MQKKKLIAYFGMKEHVADIDYVNQLSHEELKFMQQFLHEHYGNGFYGKKDQSMITTKHDKKAAIRHMNSYNRDAHSKASRNNKLEGEELLYNISENKDTIAAWEAELKAGSRKGAIIKLCNDTLEVLNADFTEANRLTLFKFYYNMKKLFKMIQKDLKNEVQNIE